MFGTFICKEVLRERQKDLLNDIESEERTFSIRNEIHALYHMVWQVDVKNSQTELEPLQIRKLTYPWLESFQEMENWNLEDIATSLNRIGDLCRKLDAASVSKERSDLAKFKKQLKSDQDRAEALEKLAKEVAKQLGQKDDSEPFDYSPVIKNLVVSHYDQIKLAEGIRNLTEKVLQKARAASEKAEKNYRLFANFSYGLYTLGFLVTLSGQLLGIKTPSEGEVLAGDR